VSGGDLQVVRERTNFTVDPKSRIARLPKPLRPFALAVRQIVSPPVRLPYVWESDGMATAHHSPFLHDSEWDALYWEMERDWHQHYTVDMRWRLWLMTALARRAAQGPGSFAEFGTYRGGCAQMLLATGSVPKDRTLHLFDTFAGIPASELTPRERDQGFEGRFEDSSAPYVEQLLDPWIDQVKLLVGDVFETLKSAQTGPLAFAHIDLNGASATIVALEYAYANRAPGATLLFDDYGWPDYPEQRAAIDEFFADKPDVVLPLPTGQALVVTSPHGAGS
jgi:O-methyltransferase